MASGDAFAFGNSWNFEIVLAIGLYTSATQQPSCQRGAFWLKHGSSQLVRF